MTKHIVHANAVCWKECSSKITPLHSEICMAFRWLSSNGITFRCLHIAIYKYFFPQHSMRNTNYPNQRTLFYDPSIPTAIQDSTDVTVQS